MLKVCLVPLLYLREKISHLENKKLFEITIKTILCKWLYISISCKFQINLEQLKVTLHFALREVTFVMLLIKYIIKWSDFVQLYG